MKSKEFVTTIDHRRIIILCVFLFSSIANSSLFSFQSSLLHAQLKEGMASYYSRKATGGRTASGERLHHDSMTCAHRTLPFGTLLRVTNMNNGKSVIVRVNDRGPYVRNRIIDLSWKAAKEIGMLAKGVASVTVEEAYRITIPLQAPVMRYELPRVETMNVELPDTLRAIWQEDELIVHPKKKNRIKKKG